MDWVDALHETQDLCGEIEVLDYRAIFIGRYSCVYKGRMKRTDELVAIKVLNPIRGTGLSTMRRKIERERKTWSSLRHPNILPLYGFADDHRLFSPFGAFISPWRARGDLGEFLIEEGEEASLKVRLHLWQGVVAGVHHLHSHQPLLVHGDLKPGNVLINNDGHAQLCDFGLVRVYLKEGHSGMTTASPHCGTERYLSWELVMAGEDAIPTAASDIYATGCIGLETLFLEKPYSRHVTNVRWHMMTDMHAGNPPATRPSNLVGQMDSLWEIISWCWERDPLFRPHAYVLSTQVANVPGVMDSEDGKAPHWPETREPLGPRNPHDQLTRSRTVQLSEDEHSIVSDHDISNLVTAIPSSNGYYDHLSGLDPAINIHEVGIRGNERVKQGSESNIDLGCTDIEEECSSAAYDDGTSLSTSGPIAEAPGTILCKPILSDTRLKSIVTPSEPPRFIVAENATEEPLKFVSVEPEISRRMHIPQRWDSVPVWDSHSQLKDPRMRDAGFGKIKAVAPAQPYPFIDAGGPLSNHLAIPPKIEDVVFSSNGHFGSGMNTSATNVYPVASLDTKPIPFDSLAAYRDPDSGMVPKLNRDYVKQPTGPSDYGLSSAQSSKNTDVAEYPSVTPDPSVLRKESGAEISNPVSQSLPDLSRGTRASFQRRPLLKLPGVIVYQSCKAVESMNPLTLIPAVNQITLTREGYPSGQSVSEMGHYFRHSRELSGGPSLSPPATTYALPAYRRSAMSRNLSRPASPPTSTPTSHSPASTAPTSGSLASTPITEGFYGALDENPDSDAQASTRGRIRTNLRSRAEIYSSLALAAGVLIEPAKPATRRIHNPISLRPNSSGCMEDHTASFMGTNLPKSPASPVIPASNSFATPRTHRISTPPCSRAAYLSSSPIATNQLANPQLSPASRIPSPLRNSARLHATAIEQNTAESNNPVGEQRQQQRGGVFSLLRPKRFSTMWRSRPKSLRLSLSETPLPLEASPSARRAEPGLFIYSKEQVISDVSVEALIGALEEGGHRATRYSPSCDSGPLRRRRASTPDVVKKVESVVHHEDEYHRETPVDYNPPSEYRLSPPPTAEVIRKKTSLYMGKKRAKERAAFGGWKEVSDVGHVDHVATSAVGHGSVRRKNEDKYNREAREVSHQIMQNQAADGVPKGGSSNGRSAELEQDSGPFAGNSLWTFPGVKRSLGPRSGQSEHGGRYELTLNPWMGNRVDLLDEGEATEDRLRERSFAAHNRRRRRENESGVMWVERSDGTLVPSGTAGGAAGKQGNLQFNEFGERKTYGYVGSPNETVVGSTTHLVGGAAQGNAYGFPKDTESDGGGTELASSLHESSEFEFGHIGKGGRAGRGSPSRSRSASKEALPLLPTIFSGIKMASNSVGGPPHAPGTGHGNHRSVPSLELNHPPRIDSSGIITASSYPMNGTPGENNMHIGPYGIPPSGTPPRLSVTPPAIPATPPRIPSIPPTNAEGFNAFVIPTNIHTPQAPQHQGTLVHRKRAALTMDLSPLTEVNSSEFPPSTSNRMSIMSALNPAAAQNAKQATGSGSDRGIMERLERQSSIGALSMENDVLVPPLISLMDLLSPSYSPPPMENIANSRERRWGDPSPKTQRVPDFNHPPASSPPPPRPPPKTDASWTLLAQKSIPMTHPLDTSFTLPPQPASNPFYPPIIPAASPSPAKQSSTPPKPNMPRPNNPFDMLGTTGGADTGLSASASHRPIRASIAPFSIPGSSPIMASILGGPRSPTTASIHPRPHPSDTVSSGSNMNLNTPTLHLPPVSSLWSRNPAEGYYGSWFTGVQSTGTHTENAGEGAEMRNIRIHDFGCTSTTSQSVHATAFEQRGIPSRRDKNFSGGAENSRSTGLQGWAGASISTVGREDALDSAWGASDMDAEDSDDGITAAWLRKWKQQRERERLGNDVQLLQGMNSPQADLPAQTESARQEITGIGFRSCSPAVSFAPPELYREFSYSDEALPSVLTYGTTLDPLPGSSSPIRPNSREDGLWGSMHIHDAPPIQVMDQDERKEVCAVCHITIRARNMERHKRSRHPKHFA